MTHSCRLSLLGAEVDAVTPDEVMSAIAQSVTAKRRIVIANHNLHSLYLFHRRSDMRAFYDKADLIEIELDADDSVGAVAGQGCVAGPSLHLSRFS
ncbi:hypothetical protein Q1W73_03915 [Asticcacaulis sp. ZE23SCel15]|uniref:hypothetical protein n=1 Tax=Asticcacaulis sp. ZE23SCel15 TaxID=3059027 RepID=UPI00265E7F60|nr:hypothetical protein [Asticcacaulis sp. ZE23SCel15]WKL58137.1 hypothetical protein Q1W73_03915 [Asticcacaulis sp. ZE23SCel15]